MSSMLMSVHYQLVIGALASKRLAPPPPSSIIHLSYVGRNYANIANFANSLTAQHSVR